MLHALIRPRAAIDRATILQYIETRQGDGAANGTINREVTMLGTMLRHAVANNKLVRLPDLRKIKLKEATPRQGFFEPEQFDWVRKRLPEDLQVAVTIAYTFGWRMQSEVLALFLRHVDLAAGTLCLEPDMTKNGEGRLVYLTPELKVLLAEQIARVKALERKLGRVIPYPSRTLTRLLHSSWAPRGPTSARHGSPPARALESLDASATTSVGLPHATSSELECPSESP